MKREPVTQIVVLAMLAFVAMAALGIPGLVLGSLFLAAAVGVGLDS